MTGAIVHSSKIKPLHLIPPEEVQVMEDLIYDRRREGYDPLQKVLEMFAGRKAADAVAKKKAETVEGRLKDRIVDGDRKGLEEELADALKIHPPLAIINDALVGVRRTETRVIVEPDRETAIRRAISEAGPGDIILLAGKGHEPYQVLKDRTIEFDDRETARRILRSFGYAASEARP